MSQSSDRYTSSTSARVSYQDSFFLRAKTRWQAIWGEARTRILVWYILILTAAFGLSVPIFRHFLFADIDARVRQDMTEELEHFRQSLAGGDDLGDREADDTEPNQKPHQKPNQAGVESERSASFQPVHFISHLVANFQTPTTSEELQQFFEAYLALRIPEDDVFLIAFVDGVFHKSSPRARPKELNLDAALMRRWADQPQPEQGEYLSQDPEIGKILYLVEPIQYRDRPLGVFVIAHSTAGEQAEGLAATGIAARVAMVLLLLSLVLVWFAAGRVLQPLQTLTTTVEEIRETNLTRRIAVRGEGELARLSAQFNEMMNRVESAFVSQRNFVNDAGHELRTPIAIIRGHLELMEANSLEQQETRTLVLDEVDRLTHFVNDLILLSNSERPDFLHIQAVEAAALTQELFAKAQALAARNWCLAEVATGKILVDPQRITQAVMNLAHNAAQHTKRNDTITIGSALEHDKIRFWVSDTGEGIALADQKRIFDRFARSTLHRRRSAGAGLGLSIVQAIVTAHGGEVTLQSQLGAGSVFAIVLPLAPAHS